MKYLIFLGSIFISLGIHNINETFDCEIAVPSVVELLEGMSSTYFPSASLINFVLYGHTDIGFGFKDFLSNFGSESSGLFPGNVVIGKDFMFGGIVGSENDFVFLPLPFGQVTKVPKDQLNKYFPKGYLIKMSFLETDYYFTGQASGTFGDFFNCDNCQSQMITFNDSDIFQLNGIYDFEYDKSRGSEGIIMEGYLNNYNPNRKIGSFKIANFAYVAGTPLVYSWHLSIYNQDNLISFSIDDANNMSYNASISFVNTQNKTNFLNFSGNFLPF